MSADVQRKRQPWQARDAIPWWPPSPRPPFSLALRCCLLLIALLALLFLFPLPACLPCTD
jgi:hypothetical protein